jgi:hypothetical protein
VTGLPASLRTLVAGVIDYAGLFPPAAESMDVALRQYAAYRQGPHAWMLGRFVVPAARLGECAAEAAAYLPAPDGPWRLSVLLGPDVGASLAAIAACNAADRGLVADAVEGRAETAEAITALGRAVRAAGLAGYVELPAAEDPTPLVEACAAAGLRAKLRTGGVTPDAFPTATEVARFLGACVRVGVAFKCTAGLHHPLRGEYRLTYDPASAQGTMFGFVNVLAAAAALRDGATDAEAARLLELRDPAAFTFTDQGLRVGEALFLTARLSTLRARGLVAVGSCSFTEPVRELDVFPGWS